MTRHLALGLAAALLAACCGGDWDRAGAPPLGAATGAASAPVAISQPRVPSGGSSPPASRAAAAAAVAPVTLPTRLRDLDFRNAALPLKLGAAAVRFTGGEAVWDEQPVRLGGVAFGDLDGDGRDEAAVRVVADITKRTMDPSRGVWLLVYSGTPTDLRLRGRRELGLTGRDRVDTIEIVAGKLLARGEVRGPGDGCLPGHRREMMLALTRRGLVERGRRTWAMGEEPARLDPPDIQRGMKAVEPQVRACGRRGGGPAVVQVSVTVDGQGRVAEADTIGKFAGTPLGDCVAAAVRRARFRRTGSTPTKLTYPFMVP
ncbi:MAG: hypothetical protein HY906_15840 [Deltaproteobacteria bacterium]|nr:hypothetical protein [Deltaproteobacteria bacterium]